MNFHYFDHAAATPLDPSVFAAMTPFLGGAFYNASATYAPARQVRQALEEARHSVAMVLGAKPAEITFTSGGTEANNLAIHGVMQNYAGANVVVSAVEHDSVLAPAGLHGAKICPVKPDGSVDVQALAGLVDDQTVLISVMYANNEVGTVQPLREIVKAVQSIRHARRQAGNMLPLYVHTDACQAANYLDLHVSRLGVDLMSLNGSKIYGPKGSGALYVRTGTVVSPLFTGGGQESGLRSGTENVAGCIGFAVALKKASEMHDAESIRLSALRDSIISTVTAARPGIKLNGQRQNRLANNVHLTVPGADAETLILQMEGDGILCAAGSACSASDQAPSHVLTAMGLDEASARSSLRITLGRHTDEASIRALCDSIITHTA